ncbi:MAG: MFS transporter [Bacteroidota bacterium]|nr:MFS transporter [Bacteroidota bacterium]
MKLSEVFRSLRHRNFALFFFGQFVSRVGMWMQRTAVIWYVYSITHSAFMIGVTAFAEQFPSFLFSIRGGIIADKYNRYRVLMFTQFLSALQAVLLTVFAFTNNANITLILILSVFLGIVNAYDVPVRQSMINDIIENKEDLPNGVALNSSLNTFARLIGPALSGFVLAAIGASYCFLANAISFVSVIGAIAAMRFPYHTFTVQPSKGKGKFNEAIHYLKTQQTIIMVLVMIALSNFLVLPFITLLPVYAKEIFKGNASTFGWLNSAMGLGAFIGAFHLATLKNSANFKKLLLLNTLFLGLCLLPFAFVSNLYVSLLLLIAIGYTSISQTSIGMTIIQTQTAKEFRGRVMSIMAMAIFGMLPLGSLLIGKLSQMIGVSNTILCEAIIGVAIAGFVSRLSAKSRG